MVKYRFQMYPYSGELFTDANASMGTVLRSDETAVIADDAKAGTTEDSSVYNTTDYIVLGEDFNRLKVTQLSTGKAAIVNFFDENKEIVALESGRPVEWSDINGGKETPIPATAKYFRASCEGRYWSSYSFTAYSNERRELHPVYKDDLAINYQKEGSNNRFLRRKLSASISFIREDYDYIMSFQWDTTLRLIIQKSVNNGDYEDYWMGGFTRLDCTIYHDDRRIEVNPDTEDGYKRILDKYDDEWNLAELAPEITRITYSQRPLLQVYVWNTGVVQNIVGGLSWQSDTDDTNRESSLTSRLYFTSVGSYVEWEVTGVLSPTETERYAGSLPELRYISLPEGKDNPYEITRLTNQNNGNYLVISGYEENIGSDEPTWNPVYLYEFFKSDGTPLKSLISADPTAPPTGSSDIKFNEDKKSSVKIYMRYLVAGSNSDTKVPEGLHKIPTDDPFVTWETTNYKYILTPAISKANGWGVCTCGRYSEYPTKYGRVEEAVESALGGKRLYYLPPDDKQNWIPISQSRWGAISYWLDLGVYDYEIDARYSHDVVCRDAFPFYSCIEKLAQRIDPRLTFKGTPEYSQFLYAPTNPVSHKISEFNGLCITQITNVSRGEYTQAAQNCTASLKWFFDLLRQAFACYWWVDDEYKIHVEHISYFLNGGSYSDSSGNKFIGIDLTKAYNHRNGKRWDFELGSCTFDKDEQTSRYEYEWSMGGTDVFNGDAIQVRIRDNDNEKKEEVSISHFITDIDYVIGAPDEISKDGWLLMTRENVYGGRGEHKKDVDTNRLGVLPMGKVEYKNNLYYSQNYNLSFAYLQPLYLTWNMIGRYAVVNGKLQETKSVMKMMSQQVNVPMGDEDIDVNTYVRTKLGDGVIKSAVFYLTTRMARITVLYDV